MEETLRRSLQAEKMMGEAGLSGAERMPLRAGLRSGAIALAPPVLEALLMVLSGSHMNEDMDAARQRYIEANYRSPATRRALGEPLTRRGE
jgi:hypothetical protein